MLAACAAALTVLAEVNPHMPRTHGDAFIPLEVGGWVAAWGEQLIEGWVGGWLFALLGSLHILFS